MLDQNDTLMHGGIAGQRTLAQGRREQLEHADLLRRQTAKHLDEKCVVGLSLSDGRSVPLAGCPGDRLLEYRAPLGQTMEAQRQLVQGREPQIGGRRLLIA
jgi:hypothetical protein